jgi:hypothetical protein
MKTDWDEYYQNPFPVSALTRRITQRQVLRTLDRFVPPPPIDHIIELGGANSCFYKAISERWSPRTYTIIDNNHTGMAIFAEQQGPDQTVELIECDILNHLPAIQGDLVFSIGLIEHFDRIGTARAIESHFALCKPGGIVLMSFPTPTWLYRSIRFGAEVFNQWVFHDERPLAIKEVAMTASKLGKCLHTHTIWPIGLTQGVIVCQST